MGAPRPLQGNRPLQLVGHRAGELQAEGIGRPDVEVVREAAAIVPDPEYERPLGRRPQLDAHSPRPPLGERVLEAIGEQFVQQEAAGGGGVQADLDLL